MVTWLRRGLLVIFNSQWEDILFHNFRGGICPLALTAFATGMVLSIKLYVFLMFYFY